MVAEASMDETVKETSTSESFERPFIVSPSVNVPTTSDISNSVKEDVP